MSSEEGSSSSSAESSAVSSSSEKILPLPDSIAGFEKIGSAGKYVYVGTEDISAKSNERPKMKVAFSYDFFLGVSEVTCSDFNKTMKDVSGLEIPCTKDSMPAADVT